MNDEFDVAAAIDAVFEFCTRTLRVVAPLVPAVKINIAFFERYLWEGFENYFSLITEANELGIEVIGDIKRGDIGHSAESYARAHLANPDFAGLEDILTPDAVTINGFAGSDSILPFADIASDQGKGVFVWVRSSNPSASILQDAPDANGVAFYERLAAVVAEIANEPSRLGTSGYSNIGMIVGGTAVQETASLRTKYPKVWFLVPGYGSQGATAADCVKFCKPDGTGAVINASRSIIYAYENPKYSDKFGDNWEKCIEQAVIDAKLELAQALR
jgi:orotidine-5'-phosphate decarboxylase